MKTVSIVLGVTPEMKEKIAAMAKEKKVSVAALLRPILEKEFTKHEE